nr:hypothetical protein Iba_chr15aCG10390 [Ipomoea batatas]
MACAAAMKKQRQGLNDRRLFQACRRHASSTPANNSGQLPFPVNSNKKIGINVGSRHFTSKLPTPTMDGDQSKRPEKSRIAVPTRTTSKLHGTGIHRVHSSHHLNGLETPSNGIENRRTGSATMAEDCLGHGSGRGWPRLSAEVVHHGAEAHRSKKRNRDKVEDKVAGPKAPRSEVGEDHLHPKFKIGIMAFCAGKRSLNPTKGLMNTCGRRWVTLFKDTLLETRSELLMRGGGERGTLLIAARNYAELHKYQDGDAWPQPCSNISKSST